MKLSEPRLSWQLNFRTQIYFSIYIHSQILMLRTIFLIGLLTASSVCLQFCFFRFLLKIKIGWFTVSCKSYMCPGSCILMLKKPYLIMVTEMHNKHHKMHIRIIIACACHVLASPAWHFLLFWTETWKSRDLSYLYMRHGVENPTDWLI